MKHKYDGLTMHMVCIAAECGFLTSSIVEVESDVTVEEFKDGFADQGGEFEVTFD